MRNRPNSYIIYNQAKRLMAYMSAIKKLKILIPVLILLISGTYVFSILYTHGNGGDFVVEISQNNNYSMCLSEENSFKNPTSKLVAKANNSSTNISVDDIPENVDNIDGSHNGDNYLAYTFYVKNNGKDSFTYEFSISIDKEKNNVSKALRVRVYENGKQKDYALSNKFGECEKNTEKFITENKICIWNFKDFNPEKTNKYTVVLWIEGDDPDCTDDLIGGYINLSAKISVI